MNGSKNERGEKEAEFLHASSTPGNFTMGLDDGQYTRSRSFMDFSTRWNGHVIKDAIKDHDWPFKFKDQTIYNNLSCPPGRPRPLGRG
jgi:hypothetical protein